MAGVLAATLSARPDAASTLSGQVEPGVCCGCSRGHLRHGQARSAARPSSTRAPTRPHDAFPIIQGHENVGVVEAVGDGGALGGRDGSTGRRVCRPNRPGELRSAPALPTLASGSRTSNSLRPPSRRTSRGGRASLRPGSGVRVPTSSDRGRVDRADERHPLLDLQGIGPGVPEGDTVASWRRAAGVTSQGLLLGAAGRVIRSSRRRRSWRDEHPASDRLARRRGERAAPTRSCPARAPADGAPSSRSGVRLVGRGRSTRRCSAVQPDASGGGEDARATSRPCGCWRVPPLDPVRAGGHAPVPLAQAPEAWPRLTARPDKVVIEPQRRE